MDWMYKNSSDTVDKEEYLLGRAIDKNFESQLSGSFNEVDRDITPASIFSNSDSNLQVDVVRKLKEDPLEQIRQKEIESRKQLLKNPVKLKKLQNMLQAKRDKEEKMLKKKAKKKKKQSNERELDDLLTSKFLQIKDKLGGKNLMDVGKLEHQKLQVGESHLEKDNKVTKKIKKKRRKSSSDSSISSDTSSTSSIRDKEKNSKHNKRKYEDTKQFTKTDMSRDALDYDECKPKMKNYGLEIRGHHGRNTVERNKPSCSYVSRKPLVKQQANVSDRYVKNKKMLSEEEKAERLKEMTQNADWRKQLTTKSIKRYKEDDKKEKDGNLKGFDEGFFRRQMALATSQTTVQDRIKSKINNIQRSENDMSKHFARR